MMNVKVGFAAMALAMMGWFSSSAVAADAEVKELNFGVISTESTANLKKGFDPFLNELEKKLGMKVNAFFAPDYAGVIEGMRFKKVDFAWFGNKSAIEAVDRAGGEVFAQTVGKDGSLGYQSLIIVHKDSPFNSIDDIIAKGKELNFGNGDPNSTSGFLIPSYYLWSKKNVDPKKHFKTARSANHESNVMAVASKQVDFATNNTENMAIFQKSNPDQHKDIKILWTSPDIPTDPIVWRKDLPREVKAKILSVFLGFGRIGENAKAELAILNNVSSGWGAFLPSDNSQLLPIRELEIAKNIQKMEGEEKIDAAEKSTRLAKLTEEQKSLAQHIELSGFWNSKKHN
jgi:phosphonate transport system substrate-binding protein